MTVILGFLNTTFQLILNLFTYDIVLLVSNFSNVSFFVDDVKIF